MRIGSLVQGSVLTMGPGHSLAEAARRMSERGVGAAVVAAEDGSPGIITERDLLRAVARGADPGATPVADYMTPDAITASPDWDVVAAARRMLDGRFRHLVVIGPEGQVVGVLSIRDLARCLADELGSARAAG
jgi:CBS domain-containing protein